MSRFYYYDQLPIDILGTYYCFLLEKLKDEKKLLSLYNEKNLIEKVAAKKKISLVELRILGYWAIRKEKNLTMREERKR